MSSADALGVAHFDADPCADDIFTLSADGASDPDGARLCAVVDAHLAYQRARTTRRRWLYLLAGSCAATWLLAMPATQLLPAWSSPAGAATSGAVVLGAAAAGLMEWYRYSRWMRAVSEHEGDVGSE